MIDIDKDKYTSFIKDEQLRAFIIKNMSKIQGVLRHFDIRRTDFMNPYEQKIFVSVLNAFSEDISYMPCGGNVLCERKLFVIFPTYLNQIDKPIKLLRLKGNFNFEKISHRDCLGALMSLGLVREKLGDIYLHDNYIDVVIDESVDNYVATNLNFVKHCSVKSEILDIEHLEVSQIDMRDKVVSVSSLRVDAIISEAFHISRSKSASLVKSKGVKVDYEPIINSSREVEDGSLFSVKGYGRFLFSSKLGISKKGRIRIKLSYYE